MFAHWNTSRRRNEGRQSRHIGGGNHIATHAAIIHRDWNIRSDESKLRFGDIFVKDGSTNPSNLLSGRMWSCLAITLMMIEGIVVKCRQSNHTFHHCSLIAFTSRKRVKTKLIGLFIPQRNVPIGVQFEYRFDVHFILLLRFEDSEALPVGTFSEFHFLRLREWLD